MYTPIDAMVEVYQKWRLKRALKNIPTRIIIDVLKNRPEVVNDILDSGKYYMRELVMQGVEEAITLLYNDVRLKYTGEGKIDEYDPAEKVYLKIKIDMTKEMVLSHLKIRLQRT